ncbi:MAG: hypothetical protein WC780_11600 [Lentimicrobiaceae bacterium]
MKKILLSILFLSSIGSVISQNWVPLYTGSSILIDAEALKINKANLQLQNGLKIKTSNWNGYLKNLVLRFPSATGDSILDGLTRFYYEYDKVEKMIRFDADRNASDYLNKSFISFSGYIKDAKIYPFVKFNYTGADWVYANRIKLVCDDETFEYDSLKFYTYGTSDFVSEYVLIPFNESMQELIPKIIRSKETIIRFYGDPIYSDLFVTDKMKMDMKMFLKTIKAMQ